MSRSSVKRFTPTLQQAVDNLIPHATTKVTERRELTTFYIGEVQVKARTRHHPTSPNSLTLFLKGQGDLTLTVIPGTNRVEGTGSIRGRLRNANRNHGYSDGFLFSHLLQMVNGEEPAAMAAVLQLLAGETEA